MGYLTILEFIMFQVEICDSVSFFNSLIIISYILNDFKVSELDERRVNQVFNSGLTKICCLFTKKVLWLTDRMTQALSPSECRHLIY